MVYLLHGLRLWTSSLEAVPRQWMCVRPVENESTIYGGMKSLERFTKMSQPCRVLHSLNWDPLKCRRAVLKKRTAVQVAMSIVVEVMDSGSNFDGRRGFAGSKYWRNERPPGSSRKDPILDWAVGGRAWGCRDRGRGDFRGVLGEGWRYEFNIGGVDHYEWIYRYRHPDNRVLRDKGGSKHRQHHDPQPWECWSDAAWDDRRSGSRAAVRDGYCGAPTSHAGAGTSHADELSAGGLDPVDLPGPREGNTRQSSPSLSWLGSANMNSARVAHVSDFQTVRARRFTRFVRTAVRTKASGNRGTRAS